MIITPFLEINEKIVQISILVVGSLQLYHFLGKFIVFHMHISLYGANLHTCWNKPGTDLQLEKWEKQIFCINFTQKKNSIFTLRRSQSYHFLQNFFVFNRNTSYLEKIKSLA